ncbi:uncharacterized protein P884DRAFT_188945 [Thermothelomyces heterothallicus CBS 202.75]|uniref:uncharacterized protein n=1 Tax=Thermothelomyces heterothallicus CBS 202.75 TaxID=1149848 RepID=UPI00374475BC
MRSTLGLLTTLLRLESIETTAFVIRCFGYYASEFLQHHPDALDPDLGQVEARVRLTMAHRPVRWLWTQKAAEAKRLWQQEEHAAAFALRILDHFFARGGCADDCDIGIAVGQIHQRLCILQSLFLGNSAWVEDPTLQEELRGALEDAMNRTKRSQVAPFFGTMC